jgi:hypothetical protein
MAQDASGAPAAASGESAPAGAPSGGAEAPAAAAPVAAASGSLPFRLGIAYAHAFSGSGTLANGPSPAAIGVDLGFGIGQIARYHLGIFHEWESERGGSAKGFRIDLGTLGFPIPVLRAPVVIHVEPQVRIVRGEILFPSFANNGGGNGAWFRIESGVAVAITASYQRWFLAVEPVSVDFRYFFGFTEPNGDTRTGFSRIWWFQVTAGREF